MKTQERVSKALRMLYKNALETRKEQLNPREYHLKNYLSDISYLHEYGTIKLCSHRQSGHTSAMIDLINRYPEQNFAILSNNQRSAKRVELVLDKDDTNKNYICMPLITNENSLEPNSLYRGLDNYTIIVDMSSSVKHSVKKCLESKLNKTNILIYLQ